MSAQLAPARTRWLLEAPVLPTLVRLSTPNLLNLFAISALVALDGIYLGRLGDDALAGVSLVFPFVMAVHHLANAGLGGAVNSAIARALGAGAGERAEALAAHAVLLAVAFAALISAAMLSGGPALYRWMGGGDAMLDAAIAYSGVAFGGAACICLMNTLASVARGAGHMLLPAAALFGAIAVYAALAPLLVFGAGPVPGLGTAGAALGLVLAFGGAAVVVFARLRADSVGLRLPLAGVALRKELFGELLRVGVPGTINVAITSATVVALTAIAGRLGREAQVGYAVAARLEYVIIPLSFTFGMALVTMVGTNWGAQQYARARQIAWTGTALSAGACGAVGTVFALFPSQWMDLFTADADVARHGAQYMSIVAPLYAAYGLGQALHFSLQGIGRIAAAVAANGARLLVSAGGGLAAIWFGAGPLGFFAAIAVGFALFAALNSVILFRATKSRA